MQLGTWPTRKVICSFEITERWSDISRDRRLRVRVHQYAKWSLLHLVFQMWLSLLYALHASIHEHIIFHVCTEYSSCGFGYHKSKKLERLSYKFNPFKAVRWELFSDSIPWNWNSAVYLGFGWLWVYVWIPFGFWGLGHLIFRRWNILFLKLKFLNIYLM